MNVALEMVMDTFLNAAVERVMDCLASPESIERLLKKLKLHPGQYSRFFNDREEEIPAESDTKPEVSKGKRKVSSSEVPSQARSRRKRSRDKDEDYDKLSTQIGEVAMAVKKLRSDRFDVKDLYDEVMKAEGFDELTLVTAFDHLVENEKVAKAFMVKNARLQKAWLEGFFNMNARS